MTLKDIAKQCLRHCESYSHRMDGEIFDAHISNLQKQGAPEKDLKEFTNLCVKAGVKITP